MKKKQQSFKPTNLSQLTIGDTVTIINDPRTINAIVDTQCCPPGSQQVIARIDLEENRIYITSPTEGSFYINLSCIESVHKNKTKTAKFGTSNITSIFTNGGNQAIRTEMTTRINTIKAEIQQCLVTTPENLFNSKIKIVDEQLRQLKLLNRNIRK